MEITESYIPHGLYSGESQVMFMWMVGLLEGEGCFQLNIDKRGAEPKYYPRVKLEMCDEDVVQMFSGFVETMYKNTTEISTIESDNPKHSDRYVLRINGKPAMQLMSDVKRLMSARRKAKINEIQKLCKDIT